MIDLTASQACLVVDIATSMLLACISGMLLTKVATSPMSENMNPKCLSDLMFAFARARVTGSSIPNSNANTEKVACGLSASCSLVAASLAVVSALAMLLNLEWLVLV